MPNQKHMVNAVRLSAQAIPVAVNEAITRILSHPSVTGLVSQPDRTEDGKWAIEINMRVPLPRDDLDIGVTETGVKAIEWIRIEFPGSFPSKAPQFLLRADFNRAHPHINPGRPGGLVSPCIYEGSLNELLHEPGWIDCLVDQMADWLSKAAAGDLMNCTGQGWEPTRRDGIPGSIVTDVSVIRAQIANIKNPICQFLRYEYFNFITEHTGRIIDENKFYYTIREAKRDFIIGDSDIQLFNNKIRLSLALITWSGNNKLVDAYHPDDVSNLDELLIRSQMYGCRTGLVIRLKEITENIKTKLIEESLDIAVIFAVKRPCNLIEQDSDIEIIPYRITFISGRDRCLHLDRIKVAPLVQIQKLNQNLLAQTSGRKPCKVYRHQQITMLGCGSLGSKIAEHLARSGHGPFKLYDKDCFSPHNSARHAVANHIAAELLLPKTWLTADVLRQVGAKVNKILSPFEDVVTALQDNPDLFARTNGLVVDTTASSSVQDALCSIQPSRLVLHLIRAALYGRGQIGFFSLEGKDRNPRIDDLTAQLYQLGLDVPSLGASLYQTTEFDRVTLGQGCSSFTMKISDARISMFSSAMAERISQNIDNGMPTNGDLLVGLLTEDGLGVTWAQQRVSQVEVIYLKDANPWELRVPSLLKQQMQTESAQRQPLETGGALIGHINWGRRIIYVTGLLPAPEDSVFRTSKFILGTKGLRKRIAAIERTTNSTLTYLGTWHSHPNGGAASSMDRKTLIELTQDRGQVPSICLIYRPEGLLAVPGPTTLSKENI